MVNTIHVGIGPLGAKMVEYEVERIDRVCRENDITCVGTGVNPGYLMDLPPTILSGLCQDVKKVEVWRFQDASVR